MRRSREVSHEERINIINRIKKVTGNPPGIGLVMSMWLLKEHEAVALLREAERVYEYEPV